MMTSKSWGEKADVPCWECRKRRLVCDQILPSCRKCRKAGRECSGYSEQRPLQWIEPGKVTSGRRKKESASSKLPTCLPKQQKARGSERDRGFFVWSASSAEAEASSSARVVESEEDFSDDIDQEQVYKGSVADHASTSAEGGRSTCKPMRDSQSPQWKQIKAMQWQIPLTTVSDPILHPGLDQRGVGLFKLYASRTSLTLAGPHSQAMWQSHIVQDAKSNDFIMHGLLSLSALHGSGVQPEEADDLLSLAWRHHKSAVASFRLRITDINAENSQAVAMFTVLMGIFSLGIPSIRGFPPETSPLSMFVDIFSLWRKAWSALGSELKNVMKGPLKPILDSDFEAPPFPIPPDTQAWLEQLQTYVKLYAGSAEDKEACLHGFQVLLDYFWCLPQFSPFTLLVCWSLNISDRFFEMLREKRPFPIFLLGHMMITFFHTPNAWLSPWSQPIIREVWSLLEEPLKTLFDWPAKYVGIVPRIAHPEDCRCFDCYMNGKDPDLPWKDNSTPLLTKLPLR